MEKKSKNISISVINVPRVPNLAVSICWKCPDSNWYTLYKTKKGYRTSDPQFQTEEFKKQIRNDKDNPDHTRKYFASHVQAKLKPDYEKAKADNTPEYIECVNESKRLKAIAKTERKRIEQLPKNKRVRELICFTKSYFTDKILFYLFNTI